MCSVGVCMCGVGVCMCSVGVCMCSVGVCMCDVRVCMCGVGVCMCSVGVCMCSVGVCVCVGFDNCVGVLVIRVLIIIIWHYNPLWVFAFSARSLQVLLSLAVSFQFFFYFQLFKTFHDILLPSLSCPTYWSSSHSFPI